ncbi:synaptotagmin-5 isoform X2 [Vespula squamosa]|uniref:Synaptotagmin-5 isoform X2 n=1 Tax=Vespula squamosa TaxID=30214 RepID=A0ABD2A463_VESSQ
MAFTYTKQKTQGQLYGYTKHIPYPVPRTIILHETFNHFHLVFAESPTSTTIATTTTTIDTTTSNRPVPVPTLPGLPPPPTMFAKSRKKISFVVEDVVPDKLSEVLGDVLELACGGGGGGGGGGSGSGGASGSGSGRNTTEKGTSAASKIGMVTGVAIIRGKWAQRGSRSPLSSVANTDSADSTTSTSSEVSFSYGVYTFEIVLMRLRQYG